MDNQVGEEIGITTKSDDSYGELLVTPWEVNNQIEKGAILANLGNLTTLDGGTLLADNGLVLAQGDSLTGHGSVNARIAATEGSLINATGDLTLGQASAFDGFFETNPRSGRGPLPACRQQGGTARRTCISRFAGSGGGLGRPLEPTEA